MAKHPYREPDPPRRLVERAWLPWHVLLRSHLKGFRFMRRAMGGLWALVRGRGEYRWVWVSRGDTPAMAEYHRFTDRAFYHGVAILTYEEWPLPRPRGYIP